MIRYISRPMGKMQKLLFVYNANSGTRNAILDSMHKVFSPKTYNCKLCDITFGVFSENKTWRRFREDNQHQMVFLHKDEFAKGYKSKFGHKFLHAHQLIDAWFSLRRPLRFDQANAGLETKFLAIVSHFGLQLRSVMQYFIDLG